MALILPNTIANDTPADGDKLQQNFETIQDWANQDAITADGSTAMSSPLLLPGPPTQPNQAATKDYVDARGIIRPAVVGTALPLGPVINPFPWAAPLPGKDPDGFATANGVTIPVGLAGVYSLAVSIRPNPAGSSFGLGFIIYSGEWNTGAQTGGQLTHSVTLYLPEGVPISVWIWNGGPTAATVAEGALYCWRVASVGRVP